MPRNTFILLIIIIALLCGSWSGFWLIRGTLSKNIISSLLDEGYENWEFSYSDISLRGFPNRTDLRIHDLKLLQQENSTDFAIGNVDILSLVYNWSEFIVSLPPSQKGFINGVEYTIVSEQPRLSLHWNENTPIPLASLIVELKQIDLNSSDLTSLTLESGLFAIKPDDINPNKFMFHLKSEQISLEIFQDKLTLEPFDFVGNAEVLLSEPTVGQCYKIEEIAVRSLQFDFGAFSINLTGNFTNQNGFPDGTLAIDFVGDKEKFFELLVANGLPSPLQSLLAIDLPIDSYEFQLKGGVISILNLVSIEGFSYSFPEIC